MTAGAPEAGPMSNQRSGRYGLAVYVAAMLAGVAAGVLATQRGSFAIAAACIAFGVLAAIVRDVRVGILAILFVLPLDVFGRVVADPVITAYQVMLVVTVAVWIWRIPGVGSPRAPFTTVELWVLALLLAGVWSLPFSLDIGLTLKALSRLTFMYLLFRLVSAYSADRVFVRRMLVCLMLTAVASSAIAYLQHVVPGFALGNTSVTLGTVTAPTIRGSAFFEDPNYLGALLSAAFAVGLVAVFSESHAWRRLAWAVGAIACLPGLYATLSRTAWVGAAAGVLVALVVVPRKPRRYLAGALATALVLVMLVQPSLLLARAGSIVGGTGTDGSIKTRVHMFGSAAEMFRDNWAMGVGLAAFERAYPPYRDMRAEATITKPHQIPLAIPAEAGVAGLVAEIGLTIAVLLALARGLRKGLTFEARLAIVGLGTLIVQTLFQNLLYFEYLWVFLALAMATVQHSTGEEEASA